MESKKNFDDISDEALENFTKELRLLYEKYKDDKSKKVNSIKKCKDVKR